MDQEELRKTFRKQELRRRETRRKILLNEAGLLGENLTGLDLKIHQAACESLREQQLRFEKATSPGYWTRLWRALWNK